MKDATEAAVAMKAPALVEVTQQRDRILATEILAGDERLFT